MTTDEPPDYDTVVRCPPAQLFVDIPDEAVSANGVLTPTGCRSIVSYMSYERPPAYESLFGTAFRVVPSLVRSLSNTGQRPSPPPASLLPPPIYDVAVAEAVDTSNADNSRGPLRQSDDGSAVSEVNGDAHSHRLRRHWVPMPKTPSYLGPKGTIVITILVAIGIAQTIVASVFFNDCRSEPHIPIFLLLCGLTPICAAVIGMGVKSGVLFYICGCCYIKGGEKWWTRFVTFLQVMLVITVLSVSIFGLIVIKKATVAHDVTVSLYCSRVLVGVTKTSAILMSITCCITVLCTILFLCVYACKYGIGKYI